MVEQPHERWRELCELAIKEPDPRRLAQLLHQLDELLADEGQCPMVDASVPSLAAEAAVEPRFEQSAVVPEGGD